MSANPPNLVIDRRVVVSTMARRGMFNPGLPHRNIAQVRTLKTWGYGLHAQLRAAAARSPHRIAVIDERHGKVSYAALLARAERVAWALHARGLGPGDAVGLLARNHLDAVAVIAGGGMLGVDLMLLNTGLSGLALAQVADQERLALVVHDDEFAPAAASLPAGVGRVGETQLGAEMAAVRPDRPLQPPPREGRTIMLTSGTTGAPRGAARRRAGGRGALVSIIDRIPLRVTRRTLLSAPVFHTWGYSSLLICLGLRHTLVLHRRFDAAAARSALQSHRCHVWIGVPVMVQRLMQLPALPGGRLRSLQVVATSGSAYPHGLTTAFMDQYGDVLYVLYGSTEASWICIATPRDLRRHPDTVGTPPLGTLVRVLDDAGREVPDGQTGRIFCGNEMVFEGYTSGEHRDSVDGLVSTGDVGHRADGLYFIDGRVDDMVVSGGENVYPAEVESVLWAHPAVREVAVLGVPDEQFGQRLAAVIALREGQTLTEAEVTDYVRSQRARHTVPKQVVFVDELPRNAMGKVPHDQLQGLVAGS